MSSMIRYECFAFIGLISSRPCHIDVTYIVNSDTSERFFFCLTKLPSRNMTSNRIILTHILIVVARIRIPWEAS